MHFLLVTVGSHGDIHPFIGVGRALVARGHRVTITTNPAFQHQIETEGLEFAAFCDRVEVADVMKEPGVFHPVLAPFVLFRKYINPLTQRGVDDLTATIRKIKPDAALVHPLCLAAPSVLEHHGLPWASCALAPLSWNNPNDHLVYQSHTPSEPSQLRSRFSLRIGRQLMRWASDGPVNRARAKMGLPPSRDFLFDLTRQGKINLGLWSPAFRCPLAGDPPAGTITGVPFFDRVRSHQNDEERLALESFLDSGPPPLLFSLGTAGVHVAGKFYESAATAAASIGMRAILLTARNEYAPARLPAGVACFRYAPFSEVLPRCAGFIHHGGIGTTSQGLRAGVPAVVAAMAFDQFDNAARVERLGAGIRFNHAKACNPKALVRALRTVLDAPRYTENARAIGEQMRREDGAGAAAAACEALLNKAASRSP
jgi:UDP:flavonoid glycosyltransferase YjiC (YdhE family)